MCAGGDESAPGPVGSLERLAAIFSAEELPDTLIELRGEMRRELEILRSAARDELDVVRTAAHSLKNSAGLLRATRLLESTRALEEAVREDRLEHRDALVAAIADELRRLEQLIVAELTRLRGDPPRALGGAEAVE